ncbi:Uncharacterised protein [uncultured archaeon]|nr:Uncharacterised protein [uncultured archaeon]
MSFIQSLAIALLITILVEYAVYLIVIRKDLQKLLLYAILINTFTNPLFNYLYNYEFHEWGFLALAFLEVAVAIIESVLIFFLMEVSGQKALLLSFAANLASLQVGMLVFR